MRVESWETERGRDGERETERADGAGGASGDVEGAAGASGRGGELPVGRRNTQRSSRANRSAKLRR